MEPLNIHDWLKVAGILVGLANISVIIYIAMRTASAKQLDTVRTAVTDGDKFANSRIDGLYDLVPQFNAKDADLHTRVSVLETQLRNMPTHADLVAINRCLATLSSELSAVSERSESTQDMVRSIQQHLMEGAR